MLVLREILSQKNSLGVRSVWNSRGKSSKLFNYSYAKGKHGSQEDLTDLFGYLLNVK